MNVYVLLILLVVSGSVFTFIYKGLDDFLIPTIIYCGALIAMTITGISLHRSKLFIRSNYVVLAIISFFLCDVMASIERFTTSGSGVGLPILLVYWCSLLFMSRSSLKSETSTDSSPAAMAID